MEYNDPQTRKQKKNAPSKNVYSQKHVRFVESITTNHKKSSSKNNNNTTKFVREKT